MRTVRVCVMMLAGSALAGVAGAETAPELAVQSQAAATLFMKDCVAFGGDARALRKFVAEQKFPALPPGGQDAFLNGLPGLAFDATDQGKREGGGKYVLVSEDDGGCSTVADHADPATLLPALEKVLAAAGMTVEKTSQRSDPLEPALTHTGYFATKGATTLSLLVSTSGEGGEAMLSLLRPLVAR